MKRIFEIKRIQSFTSVLPGRLHLRSDLHLARKIWHMAMGVIIVTLYHSGVPQSNALLILGSILGVDILLETLRLRVPALNEKIIRLWGPLMRANEAESYSGVSSYLAATVLAILFFPKTIAILSILYLACGDPVASFFGILYGKYGLRLKNGKSIIGAFSAMLVCAVITFVLLSGSGMLREHLLFLTLFGGFLGGAVELLPLEIDDNFSIPLISGISLWLVFIILGY